MNLLVDLVEEELLPNLEIESVHPHEPVVIRHIPEPWQFVGAGNYTAVVCHPDHPRWVVKVYAPGRPGLEAEAEVYRRLGPHPAYSRCLHAGQDYLILERLHGVTLYECFLRGIPIPEQVIADVDAALHYARSRGLHPRDVHAKNVMMQDGHGLVVDVSDFLEPGRCTRWADLKRAYFRLYRPLLGRRPVPIPAGLLNLIRRGYRLYKRFAGDATLSKEAVQMPGRRTPAAPPPPENVYRETPDRESRQ